MRDWIRKKIRTRSFRANCTKAFVYLLLITGSLLILSPVLWMVSTSLKSMDDIMQYPPTIFPKVFHWENYVLAWKSAPFTRFTLNTLFITACVVIGNVLSNSFIAYGFAKIRFPGRNLLFYFVLGTMMIPGFVTMIPQYILYTKLDWIGSYLPLIVPSFFGGAYFLFLLRQFYKTIPDELIEAARLDGASHFYIWLKIMVPLAKPAIATIAIFSFNGAWNDFVGPLLYVNSEKLYTLQVGLHTFRGQAETQWNYLMAASVLVLLPVVILFFTFQKYFIEGMDVAGSSKG